MGLFDFFKKKSSKENNDPTNDGNKNTPPPASPSSGLYSWMRKYNEYLVRYMGMHAQGSMAPISAYERTDGDIIGFLYVYGKDKSYVMNAGEVIDAMEARFEKQIANNEINSYMILYHSQFAFNNNHKVASNDDELKGISIIYHFKNGPKGKLGMAYTIKNDSISYSEIRELTLDENRSLFSTQLQRDKDYFQEREEMVSPVSENSIGIKMKKSNECSLSHTWGGMMGFEAHNSESGEEVIMNHFRHILHLPPVYSGNDLMISRLDFDKVYMKTIVQNNQAKTIIPVIKTDRYIDVVNKEINEWVNVDSLEAVISGGGRDTFLVQYFATDYAEKKDIYHSQKNVKVKLSGIAFVLDEYTKEKTESEIKFSDDFTTYMPNADLTGHACFDFIGEVEDFQETKLLLDNSLTAYIMKVRLITHPDIKDFFTIDMYVSPENMRFSHLNIGMKVTGMFQLQGELVG